MIADVIRVTGMVKLKSGAVRPWSSLVSCSTLAGAVMLAESQARAETRDVTAHFVSVTASVDEAVVALIEDMRA